MFSENLKAFRKQKGLSQEELAERLHVVRQTVSKWERGQSVPDAELLIRIAEIFETSVSTLLGDTVQPQDQTLEDVNLIAEKLEQLNLLLAERNRRSRRIWKIVGIVFVSLVGMTILTVMVGLYSFGAYTYTDSSVIIKEQSIQVPVYEEKIEKDNLSSSESQ